jgi:hypothetical protein
MARFTIRLPSCRLSLSFTSEPCRVAGVHFIKAISQVLIFRSIKTQRITLCGVGWRWRIACHFQTNNRITDVRNPNRKSLTDRPSMRSGIVESCRHNVIRIAERLCLHGKAFELMPLVWHRTEIRDAPFNHREMRLTITQRSGFPDYRRQRLPARTGGLGPIGGYPTPGKRPDHLFW